MNTLQIKTTLILMLFSLMACATPLLPTAEESSPVLDMKLKSEVQEIMQHTKIRNAFTKIEAMEESNVLRLIELTEIPAPPFMEEVRAAELVRLIKAAGLSNVLIDETGNVIAKRSGTKSTKTVALVAHLDTVFPKEMEIKVIREGKKLTAPGVGDNTQALIAMLTLIEVMQEFNIQTENDILFIGSVGEEGLGDLRGVRHLFGDKGIKIDSFIAMDGGASERLIVDAVGSNRYKVTFNGPGGHSYGAYGRAHPHQALAEAIIKFTEDAKPITELEGLKATFSVGRIGGGTSINSIPFSSWMEVDMRSQDPEKLAKLDKTFQAAMQYALEKENARKILDESLTVDIKPVGKRPAGNGDRSSSLVQNAITVMQAMGIEPQLKASSTDSNVPISLGIPSVTISRGGKSKDAHSPDESWESINPHIAIQSALLLLASEAGMVLQ